MSWPEAFAMVGVAMAAALGFIQFISGGNDGKINFCSRI